MRKRHFVFAFCGLFLVLAAFPAVNAFAAYRGKTSWYNELRLGKQEVYVIGHHAEYLSGKLQEYSDAYGYDLVVSGPKDKNEANTVLVPLVSIDDMDQLPEYWQLCGSTCREDTDEKLYTAAVSETALWGRNWKIVYIRLKSFEADGTLDGEGFICVMHLMANEAKYLFPEYGPDFNVCRERARSEGKSVYRASTSFNLFKLRIGQ